MTTEIEDRPSTTNRSLGITTRVSRGFRAGVHFFRRNRQLADQQFLIDGNAARRTVFDRTREDWHRPFVETTKKAFDEACEARGKPYSLASAVVRYITQKVASGLVLLGWVVVALGGAGLALSAAISATKPDEAVQYIFRNMQDVQPPPTITDHRRALLMIMAMGIGALVIALYRIWRWWQPQSPVEE